MKKNVSLWQNTNDMKKLLLLFFLLTSVMWLKAQTISVVDFSMDPSDLTANTAGTIVTDQNGNKCALIKIETTQTGFSFDAGSLGIVKTEQKVGEIWVYVPEGVKRLSISHPKLGALRNYDLGQTVKRARTYLLRLNMGENSPLKHSNESQYLVFKVIPQDAIVIVDGETLITKNGTAEIMKEYGTYDYRVEALNCKPEVGKVTIDEQSANKVLTIELKNEIEEYGQSFLTFKVGETEFSMIYVEGGTFQMGGDANSDVGSKEVHQVTLSSYYIGETEVTQELWMAVMGKDNNPSTQKSNQLPVTKVSWDDCQEFLVELNKKTGRSFRLPTEAEWEFAARGGVKSRGLKYSGSNFLGDVGWYINNSMITQNSMLRNVNEVKTKNKNELGIYDMSGNVSEWCNDWFGNYPSQPQIDPAGPATGSKRVMRGGHALSDMKQCGVAFRAAATTSISPGLSGLFYGFRIVLK